MANEKNLYVELMGKVKTAGSKYVEILNTPSSSVSVKTKEDAKSDLDLALDQYNTLCVNDMYRTFINNEKGYAPLVALCLAHCVDQMTYRVKFDKKQGVYVGSVVPVSTRLSILDFFTFCTTEEIPMDCEQAVLDAMSDFSGKLISFITSDITFEGGAGTSIKDVRQSLYVVLKTLGFDGEVNGHNIKARNVDVRFLVYALTHVGGKQGRISAIKEDSVYRFLMDVFYVQTRGKKYEFDSAKESK